jgi:hypothetical protein
VPLTSRLSGLRFRAEVSHSVWLNLPPARVWVYRAGEAPAANVDPRPTREDWLDRLRQRAREKSRELQLEFEARFEPPLRRPARKRAPAFALLRRLGDNGKGRR